MCQLLYFPTYVHLCKYLIYAIQFNSLFHTETTNLCVEIMNSNEETWSRVTHSRLPFDVNVKLNLFNDCFPRDDPRDQSLNVYYCRTSSSRGDQVFRLLTLETLVLNTWYTLLVQKLLVCNADQSDVNKSWRIFQRLFLEIMDAYHLHKPPWWKSCVWK